MRNRLPVQSVLGNMRIRILTVTALLLAGSSAVSLLLVRNVLNERLDEEIRVALGREVEEFALLTDGINPATGAPFGDDVGAIFDVYFSREVPDEGETLLAFVDGELYDTEHAPDAVPAEELDDVIPFWLVQEDPLEGAVTTSAGAARYAVFPIAVNGRRGHFVATVFPRAEQQEIDDAVATEALVQAATIAIATIIGYGFSGKVLSPLRSLADTARRISDTDLTRRIPVTGRDEASQIALAFNDMLARLEAAFDIQRRFLDEVSHEFRAPLTVIRGHLELLDLEDPGERAETTRLITDEIDRMNRMVEDLLTLARVERPDFLDLGPVDLGDWTTEVFRKASVLCGREWSLESTGQGTIVADQQRLTQAVMQLAENACRHTVPGTRVRLGSALTGTTVRIWMEDDGLGVRPEDADRIFQRFQRGRRGTRSTGLGLSIVSAIAESHGGRAWVVSDGTTGARFEIELPVTARAATSG